MLPFNNNSLFYSFKKLGGNVGLFTGMSILSLFEIAFWLVRFVLRSSGKRDRSENTHKNGLKARGKKLSFLA